MRLYKFYRGARHNFNAVANGQVWLSHPSEFNDPLDCRFNFNDDAHDELLTAALKILFPGNSAIAIRMSAITRLSIEAGRNLKDVSIGDTLFKFIELTQYQIPKLKELRKAVRSDSLIKLLDAYITTGVVSFTTNENLLNPAHWAYYADNSKGFCVEWEVDLGKFKKKSNNHYQINLEGGTQIHLFRVQYKEKLLSSATFSTRSLLKHYRVKIKRWKNESEWRLVAIGETRKLLALPIKPRAIYIGYSMTKERKKRLENKFKKLDCHLITISFFQNGFSSMLLPKNLLRQIEREKKKRAAAISGFDNE